MDEFKVERLEEDPEEKRTEQQKLFARLLLTAPGGATDL